ncbi:tubulin-specific chaperone, putative [Paecilomyces variotii No. 5]|uniref:Tubulin-specific chaperone E n=1 Tax=Byssochlamys spectabilis (strain No. 5 / NBRC 109023) TaxID=1356009 RepID=V5HXG4_BYSSN|nr:tubulin-specific chaperone, putative [Paecilomyces variotii No. 5]
MSHEFYEGQRLSFDGALCTVRYIGKVEGTTGEWLGVEWDDPTRGKHSGEHKGVKYFQCKSNHPTAGSFVRPSRPTEKPRGFLEAVHEKYASEFEEELAKSKQKEVTGAAAPLPAQIKFNGKVVEEVGFEKIRKKLAELQELKFVILDGLRIAGLLATDVASAQREKAVEEIEKTCPRIVELDLSRNLLRRWVDVRDICKPLKKIRLLKLNGNRFEAVNNELTFERISELHLDDTVLTSDEIALLSHQFPSLTSLTASANQISSISSTLSPTVRNLTLENNEISSLFSIRSLGWLPNLDHLSLRGNEVCGVFPSDSPGEDASFQFSPTLRSLDVSRNNINSWSFVNALPRLFPGLKSLRISDNPLYDQPVAPSNVTNLPEKPMTVEEAFMLTLARLRNLESLNYSKITPQERTNGELYYLSLIGKELSAHPESAEKDILANHPRYGELCNLYGEPIIKRVLDTSKGDVNPRSVAARLIRFAFYLPTSSSDSSSTESGIKSRIQHIQEIPRTFDVYRVKAIVSRLFDLTPLGFRLIWETEEWDPVDEADTGLDEWDSSDDDEPDASESENQKTSRDGPASDRVMTREDGNKFVKREVELVDSTRQVGYWFNDDLKEATVRVEVL